MVRSDNDAKVTSFTTGGSKADWLARYKQGLTLQCLNNIRLTIIQKPGVKMVSDAHS